MTQKSAVLMYFASEALNDAQWQRLVYLTLRRKFGPKKYEVIEACRKLHNEELNDLYCSLDTVRVIKSRKNQMDGVCSAYGGERRGVYRVLVGKPEGKRTLGRPKRRREHNFKMDLQEVGCGV